jgi:hypothetical protein
MTVPMRDHSEQTIVLERNHQFSGTDFIVRSSEPTSYGRHGEDFSKAVEYPGRAPQREKAEVGLWRRWP